MTKEQILQEVANSSWQPEFEFTDDLDAVVDSILKPHEDYFLGLHSKVKEIIERETNGVKAYSIVYDRPFQITFADVCSWQKELFEYKNQIIRESLQGNGDLAIISETKENHHYLCKRIKTLPNQHINLGLRSNNVKVGKRTYPAPMFLEDLKEMCLPISIDYGEFLTLPFVYDEGLINKSKVDAEYFKYWITQWYKVFKTIRFFEDLNERLGGIIINSISYILIGKYLIRK